MDNFFKKAMGLFVDFVPENEAGEKPVEAPLPPAPAMPVGNVSVQEVTRFEQHFNGLLEQANQPGPDYYEYLKMMDALAGHVPDERSRMIAVFVSLQAQGLSKEALVNSAHKYQQVMEADRVSFEQAAGERLQTDVERRRLQLQELGEQNKAHEVTIRELQQQIAQNQAEAIRLQDELSAAEHKLAMNTHSYQLACTAVLNKIQRDIEMIQTNL